MADSLAGLNTKLSAVDRGLNGSSLRTITTRVATKAKPVLTAGITPSTLSHYGRRGKGAKVTARFEIKSDHEALMRPTPAGLAALLEKGSGTTWKAPKRRGSKRRKKGTVGSYTRAKVPARKAWSKGVDKMAPRVPHFVDEEVRRVLGQIFGGS